MLALASVLTTRLQSLPALIGWDVRSNAELAERRQLPAADVRCIGANVSDTTTGAAMVQPQWLITLVVRRGAGAADQLDAAFAATFAALHNWPPGTVCGRAWERMSLTNVSEPTFADEGLIGYELTFFTAARFMSDNT